MLWDYAVAHGAQGIATVVVLLVVISLIRGWLVPRRVLMDAVALSADRLNDKEIENRRLAAERDAWHGAFDAESKINASYARQAEDFTETSRTMIHLLESLPPLMESLTQPQVRAGDNRGGRPGQRPAQ